MVDIIAPAITPKPLSSKIQQQEIEFEESQNGPFDHFDRSESANLNQFFMKAPIFAKYFEKLSNLI